MRAIVIEQPNAVSLRNVETGPTGLGEVRVRSVVAGVCRTDLDIDGHRQPVPGALPCRSRPRVEWRPGIGADLDLDLAQAVRAARRAFVGELSA